MNSYIATITSKRQLTLPSALFKKLDFMEGEKLLVSEENGYLRLCRLEKLLDKLGGSVKVPARFKGLDPDELIKVSKKEHLRK